MASTPDGPRYVVGLRSKTDPCCYKDMIEGEKEGEAKQQADELAVTEQRATIVYDRKLMAIIYRVPGPEIAKQEPVSPPETPAKRGKNKR